MIRSSSLRRSRPASVAIMTTGSMEHAAQAREPGESQRKRVGHVGGRWKRVEFQEPPDRVLYLMLRGGAGGGYRALHLGRGQREHGDVALARGEADDATGVGHEQRRPREPVLGVEILEHERR